MDEPIEKQIEEAQPKGPFKMRWLRNLGAKGTIGAGCLLFVFIYQWTHRPMGPVQASTVKPQPVQVIEEPKKQQPPMQTAGFTTTAPLNQGNTERGYAAVQQPQLDPIKEMQQERRKMLIQNAFADNVVKIEKVSETSVRSAAPAEPGLENAGGIARKEKADPDKLLPEGTALQAVLDSKLAGDFTGPVYAHVASDVYIPRTRQLVIPQGAWLLGSAERVGSVGQSRIAVSFHAIKVFDDNKNFCTIDLGKQPGLDQQGGMGLTGKVNNHTASLIATGAVLALIQGAALSIGYQGGGYDPRSQVIANMGSGTAQVASRILEPRANRPPTITIPEGTRINIALTKDLDTTCTGAGE
jgi:type IV secretory pathway VirB10-like protein